MGQRPMLIRGDGLIAALPSKDIIHGLSRYGFITARNMGGVDDHIPMQRANNEKRHH